MPSTYAHYRMGQEVRRRIEGTPREIIEKYPQLYLIGLHGPDILFYYGALFSNSVNEIGYELHKHSGQEFFQRAKEVILQKKHKEPYLAYIYGVLNHFALDVNCHGYVERKIQESGISHTEIEVEFDRMLMIHDRKDPIRQNLTQHIVPSQENAVVIQCFYPGADAQQVMRALKGMIRCNRLLIAPSKLKRNLIWTMLRITGNYQEMQGLIVNYQANPFCKDSNQKLKNRYLTARTDAVSFIREFMEFVEDKRSLGDIFRYSFGSVDPERGEMYEI
ncbi:MAG: zinc dependent phospholipase C family protein [Lachnospiraceae bacterium]|nr:zinc dependent phospholipase C family protein [Lachnospiraceae bacterium]